MYITIKLGNHRLPLVAPTGAVLFTVKESATDGVQRASVLFAICREGETELAASLRIRRDYSAQSWHACAARAGSIKCTTSTPEAQFACYDFEYMPSERQWKVVNSEAAEFFSNMSRLNASVGSTPRVLFTSPEKWIETMNVRGVSVVQKEVPDEL